MKTLEIKAGKFMTEEQALTIAKGDSHEAWVLMENHNDYAYRLIKQADGFEREHHFDSLYEAMDKVCIYEYAHTKEELEEIALVNSFTKTISGTQAFYHTPYFFSEEEVEWDDIPF